MEGGQGGQPFQRGTSPTLSLREKALLKRRINKEHNSNFRAGYVQVQEEQLHKTGIRGRKRYFIYILLCLAIIVVIVNFLITVTLLAVLGIGHKGIKGLEFIPSGALLRFLGHSDLGQLHLYDSQIMGRPQEGMDVSGEDGRQILLQVKNGSSKLRMTTGMTQVVSKEGFEVIDPDTGETIFTTDFSQLRLPEQIESLSTRQVFTNRVTSDVGQNLELSSDAKVTLRGNEGLFIDGGKVTMTANDDISVGSTARLVLSGSDGVVMDTLPLAQGTQAGTKDTYKICVCMPSGRLFTVPSPRTCQQANEDHNPCLDTPAA